MKTLLTTALLASLVATASAREPGLAPAPLALLQAPTPAYSPVPAVPMQPTPAAQPITLFECVNVRGANRIHPCAVPTLVSVQDPCNECCCVNVEVCLPPCDCFDVRCNRAGNRVTYDFGKYGATLVSHRGVVTVIYRN